MRSTTSLKETRSPNTGARTSSSPATESASVIENVKKTLADEYTLQLKTQNAHWNIEGPNFFSLHKLFEEQYEHLFKFVDRTAETLRALKSTAPGSFKEFKDLASIQEFSNKVSYQQFIDTLGQDHTNMAIALKARLESAQDAEETSCVVLYEDLIKFHEKAAWMIRSHHQ